MQRYKDTNGDSGIWSYEKAQNSIIVVFNDGWHYLYDTNKCILSNILEMHRLADLGDGLNSFINKNVRKLYSDKYYGGLPSCN